MWHLQLVSYNSNSNVKLVSKLRLITMKQFSANKCYIFAVDASEKVYMPLCWDKFKSISTISLRLHDLIMNLFLFLFSVWG